VTAADVCANALRSGLTPPEIATQQGVSLSSVLSYLDQAVGENKIARSEIYFSIPVDARTQVERACREREYQPLPGARHVSLEPVAELLLGVDVDLVQVCLAYGPASRYYGELYELVRRYEIDLHNFVRHVLVNHQGEQERRWWYTGVSVNVRKGCAERAEELGRFGLDPWTCTYLLDLQAVIKDQWSLFDGYFRVASRNEVFTQIKTVNDVRNRVMHPVRDTPPTDEDFDTLEEAYARLAVVMSRFYDAAPSSAPCHHTTSTDLPG
jgi:hypothetical protein